MAADRVVNLGAQFEVVVEGVSHPTRRAAAAAYAHAVRHLTAPSGGPAELPSLGHVAVVILTPTERCWAGHFVGAGVWVIARRADEYHAEQNCIRTQRSPSRGGPT